MKKNSIKWIDRWLVLSPYSIGLCQSEETFKSTMKRLKVPLTDQPKWIPEGKGGQVHRFKNVKDNSLVSIVCIRDKKRELSVLYGMLIHEAVHVWQDIKKEINEDEPSHEFEAYAIQDIAQRLIEAYK